MKHVFNVVTEKLAGMPWTYEYCNMNGLNEKYIDIYTKGTFWKYSFVTFKPANIPDAPTMVVDTNLSVALVLLCMSLQISLQSSTSLVAL